MRLRTSVLDPVLQRLSPQTPTKTGQGGQDHDPHHAAPPSLSCPLLATPVVVANATASKTAPAAAGTVVANPKAQEPTCVRQIKIVYAGYGEAQAVPCTTFVAQ